jgi:hypothetical protein
MISLVSNNIISCRVLSMELIAHMSGYCILSSMFVTTLAKRYYILWT